MKKEGGELERVELEVGVAAKNKKKKELQRRLSWADIFPNLYYICVRICFIGS